MAHTFEKKILFVSTQFPPNDSIGTQRIVKFIKYLKLKGWEIHVLTLDEKYYRNSDNNYQFYIPEGIHVCRKKKIDIFGIWDSLKNLRGQNSKKIKRGVYANNGNGQSTENSDNLSSIGQLKEFISNLLQYPDQENGFFFNLLFTAFRLISQHKIPFVFVSSPPHSPVVPITLLRKFINFCFIVDFRDPWARSQWQQKPKRLYQRIEKKLDLFFEEKALKTADVAIFNTEQLQMEFKEYYANTSVPQKFHFISNGFDPELKARLSAGSSQDNGKENRITLLHAGTLYKKRNPHMILEGLLKFRELHPDKAKAIELRFIGTLSEDQQYLHQYIMDKCLTENVRFESKLSYDMVFEEMKAADWMVLLQPGTTFQIPAKFYDYLLVDKPIWGVLEKNSVGEKAIEQLGIGYVSDCTSVESIVEFFEFISAEKKQRFSPDESELQKYGLPSLVDQFEDIILNHRKV